MFQRVGVFLIGLTVAPCKIGEQRHANDEHALVLIQRSASRSTAPLDNETSNSSVNDSSAGKSAKRASVPSTTELLSLAGSHAKRKTVMLAYKAGLPVMTLGDLIAMNHQDRERAVAAVNSSSVVLEANKDTTPRVMSKDKLTKLAGVVQTLQDLTKQELRVLLASKNVTCDEYKWKRKIVACLAQSALDQQKNKLKEHPAQIERTRSQAAANNTATAAETNASSDSQGPTVPKVVNEMDRATAQQLHSVVGANSTKKSKRLVRVRKPKKETNALQQNGHRNSTADMTPSSVEDNQTTNKTNKTNKPPVFLFSQQAAVQDIQANATSAVESSYAQQAAVSVDAVAAMQENASNGSQGPIVARGTLAASAVNGSDQATTWIDKAEPDKRPDANMTENMKQEDPLVDRAHPEEPPKTTHEAEEAVVWIGEEEFRDSFSEQEAKELAEKGLVKWRVDPDAPARNQYTITQTREAAGIQHSTDNAAEANLSSVEEAKEMRRDSKKQGDAPWKKRHSAHQRFKAAGPNEKKLAKAKKNPQVSSNIDGAQAENATAHATQPRVLHADRKTEAKVKDGSKEIMPAIHTLDAKSAQLFDTVSSQISKLKQTVAAENAKNRDNVEELRLMYQRNLTDQRTNTSMMLREGKKLDSEIKHLSDENTRVRTTATALQKRIDELKQQISAFQGNLSLAVEYITTSFGETEGDESKLSILKTLEETDEVEAREKAHTMALAAVAKGRMPHGSFIQIIDGDADYLRSIGEVLGSMETQHKASLAALKAKFEQQYAEEAEHQSEIAHQNKEKREIKENMASINERLQAAVAHLQTSVALLEQRITALKRFATRLGGTNLLTP